MRHYLAILSLLVGVLSLGACRERERVPQQRPHDPLAPIVFDANAEMVFIFADLSGRFQNAMKVSGVPKASRRAVRVIDPTVKGGDRGDYEVVHVVDLTRAPDRGGEYRTTVVSRHEFERRALAQLPPGAASRIQIPGSGADLAEVGEIAPHDQIILYGTSWCGACKQAREFLRARQVTFIERDVERDVGAAAELARKAATAGIAADRVPIIDVRGRLLVGFDPVRLTTLLGDQI